MKIRGGDRMKLRRFFSIVLVLAMLVGMVPQIPMHIHAVEQQAQTQAPDPGAQQAEPVQLGKILYSGECGEDLTWALDDAGLLYISGTGTLYADAYSDTPWYSYRDQVRTAIMDQGITDISYAFEGCSNLTSVVIPNNLTSIGNYAFYGCENLETVDIPKTVT